jgi:hypothetical protein
MLNINKKAKSLLTVLLAVALVFAVGGQTVVLGEEGRPKSVGEQFDEQILAEMGVEQFSPEYYALYAMWTDYFLDLLPDDTHPEALQRLTALPAYDDTDGWDLYIHGGDYIKVRDTAFLYANKLGVANNSTLTAGEKARIIAEWAYSGEAMDDEVIGTGTPIIDGYVYDCVARAEGLASIYRIAGIPALGVSISKPGVWHEEGFFYVDGAWRNVISYEHTLRDYVNSHNFMTDFEIFSLRDQYVVDENNPILDLDLDWVGVGAERFMLALLKQPYIYPNEKLTRGMTAKLLCNYMGVAPMRNEKVFSDVTTEHKYSRYIWAVNKLGIMGGNGDGTFRPDSELSMQEFATVAMRVLEHRGGKLSERAAQELRDIQNNPTDWPPDLQYTKDVVQRLAEEADWKRRVAKISQPTPLVFADNSEIAAWAKPAVDEFSKLGILQGDSTDSDSRLRPTEPLSKTRFLVFMAKFEEKLQLSHKTTPTPLF